MLMTLTNAQVSTYIAETVESEVADEGSGPYEDEGGIITLWAWKNITTRHCLERNLFDTEIEEL